MSITPAFEQKGELIRKCLLSLTVVLLAGCIAIPGLADLHLLHSGQFRLRTDAGDNARDGTSAARHNGENDRCGCYDEFV